MRLPLKGVLETCKEFLVKGHIPLVGVKKVLLLLSTGWDAEVSVRVSRAAQYSYTIFYNFFYYFR